MRKIFFATIGLIVLCSWITLDKSEIKNAKWLIGTWENKTKKGTIYETWTKVSKTEFQGKSYKLKDKDTIVFETIRLVQEKNSLYYIPIVKNQNNELPVKFSGIITSKNKLVFENKAHDFPQIISYSKINKDSLVAEISGSKGSKELKQSFPMKRIK